MCHCECFEYEIRINKQSSKHTEKEWKISVFFSICECDIQACKFNGKSIDRRLSSCRWHRNGNNDKFYSSMHSKNHWPFLLDRFFALFLRLACNVYFLWRFQWQIGQFNVIYHGIFVRIQYFHLNPIEIIDTVGKCDNSIVIWAFQTCKAIFRPHLSVACHKQIVFIFSLTINSKSSSETR